MSPVRLVDVLVDEAEEDIAAFMPTHAQSFQFELADLSLTDGINRIRLAVLIEEQIKTVERKLLEARVHVTISVTLLGNDKVQVLSSLLPMHDQHIGLIAIWIKNRNVIKQPLKKNIVFAHHNLVCDQSFNEFNAILCRNVMIYFNGELQGRVHKLIFGSLRRFGVLALGQKESLKGTPHETDYEELVGREKLYRRLA